MTSFLPKHTLRFTAVSLYAVFILSACETVEETATESSASTSQNISIRTLNEAEVIRPSAEEDEERLIADLLYEGLQYLDADRLMTPIDGNAYARFRRVLALQPGNNIALEGMQTITERYVALAREATRRGLFDEAEVMLDRAKYVNPNYAPLAAAAAELVEERLTEDLFFELDGREVAAQDEQLKVRLQEIAQQAMANNAFVSVTAANDELGRWIFVTMRDSLPGYRLRGNIEISGTTTIRLRLPES